MAACFRPFVSEQNNRSGREGTPKAPIDRLGQRVQLRTAVVAYSEDMKM